MTVEDWNEELSRGGGRIVPRNNWPDDSPASRRHPGNRLARDSALRVNAFTRSDYQPRQSDGGDLLMLHTCAIALKPAFCPSETPGKRAVQH